VIKLKRMRQGGHVASMGEKANAYVVLVENFEGKSLLGRPGSR
jgi:hypothetical protein